MGPSTVPTPLGSCQRRSTRTALLTTTNEENDGTKQQHHFPRRWPGVGSSFQCKVLPQSVAGSVYTTDRAAPDRMSEEYPHCTQMEVETTITASRFTADRGKEGLEFWNCLSMAEKRGTGSLGESCPTGRLGPPPDSHRSPPYPFARSFSIDSIAWHICSSYDRCHSWFLSSFRRYCCDDPGRVDRL
jgi:hypothetical protein